MNSDEKKYVVYVMNHATCQCGFIVDKDHNVTNDPIKALKVCIDDAYDITNEHCDTEMVWVFEY